jgi:hypothetical protein
VLKIALLSFGITDKGTAMKRIASKLSQSLRLFFVLGSLPLLVNCSIDNLLSYEDESGLPATCPAIQILEDSTNFRVFQTRMSPSPLTLKAEVFIESVDSQCRFVNNTLDIDHIVRFDINQGPAGLSDLNVPYFIALLDANGDILGKISINLAETIDPTASQATITQVLNQVIDNPDIVVRPTRYTFAIGFRLTPEVIEANRAQLQRLAPQQIASEQMDDALNGGQENPLSQQSDVMDAEGDGFLSDL